MIKPRVLRPGAKIGVVAPAGAPDSQQEVEQGLAVLAKMGLEVRLGSTVGAHHGYLAGTDEERASELMEMFTDPELQGVFCLRGGWGSLRILERLDYGLIGANPKIFLGYSDITSLHLALGRCAHVVTLHGPMVFELGRVTPLSLRMLQRALFEPEPLGTVFPIGTSYTIRRGSCRGQLIGGNLSLLAASLGTPFELDTRGKILFFEDIDEEPYRVDRMLTQMKLAGKLDEAAGIVVGECINCEAEPGKKSLTLKEVLLDHLAPLPVPSYYGVPSGHGRHNIVLPFGVTAALDAEFCQLEIVEAATR